MPDIVIVGSGDIGSLSSAISNISSNTIIKLSGDADSYGISVPSNSSFVLDLNDSEIQLHRNANNEYAGSSGTKTNGFQFLAGSNISIQNGEISADDTKILVQNYSNLTLKDVILKGSSSDTYVLSNNFGQVHLKGTTQILATGDVGGKENVAFDLWYGMSAVYDAGVSVFIDDPTVVIQGPIEFGHASRITSEEQFLKNTHLYVCRSYDLSSLRIPAGYHWEVAANNMYELRPGS